LAEVDVKRWKEVISGIEVEVLEFADTVETVEKASRVSSEPPSRIVKTLLLKMGNEYIIVVVRGDRKVDYKKASRLLGFNISLARPEEVKAVLGVEPGTVTPITQSVRSLRTILDPAILETEYILCGGGSLHRLFRLKTKDLLNFLNPEVLDIFK